MKQVTFSMTLRLASLLAASAVLITSQFATSQVALAQEPRVDGLFAEWSPSHIIATDPAGDATGAFDVQKVFAVNRGTKLFLRFEITSIRNLQSGATADGTLLVQISMPGNRALTIDVRNRSLWRDNDQGLTVTWSSVGYTTAPTYAASEFELVVDLATFGVVVGNPITINFSSSDSLTTSAPFTMTQPAVAAMRRSAVRATGSAFRVASVNTEQTGFLNSTRRAKILRLVDGMNADIYCFQEEYTSTATQIDTYLTGADPMDDGADWNVHKNNDCVIASRSVLLALPSPNTAPAGAIVDLPLAGPSDAVVVFSIHPKCCGYIGSSEDATRLTQMTGLITTLNNLRAGTLGAAFEPYRQAPALIIGDWNLVGSITPLTMVLDPAGPNMRDAFAPQLIGEDVATWRGSATTPGSFTPGRLDLITSSASGMHLRGSFVLDSATLDVSELAALALQSGDSAATDHNMLVADFAFGAMPNCAGDTNGDNQVNGADIALVLSSWGGGGPAGDVNGDGTVNAADLTVILSNFGQFCQ